MDFSYLSLRSSSPLSLSLPLSLPLFPSSSQVVHLLLKKKADPTIVVPLADIYAVHLFLQNGLSKAIEAMEKSNQGQEEEDIDPLSSFLVPIVQRLLAGVDVNTQTKEGLSFFDFFCWVSGIGCWLLVVSCLVVRGVAVVRIVAEMEIFFYKSLIFFF